MLELLGWAFCIAGGFFTITGGIGVLRLWDLYTRCHAGSVSDTGCLLILIALILKAGITLVGVKLLMIVLLLVFTNPASAHALAQAALARNLKPKLGPREENSVS